MKQLHPKSVWLFFFPSLFQIFLFLLIFGYSIATILISSVDYKIVGSYFFWLIALVVIMIIFSYIWAVLSYNSYRYELTENGFHKQLGVIIKKDVTIPYDRIQNIDINRGIMAQILGLSDLNIQTAGSSIPMGGWWL